MLAERRFVDMLKYFMWFDNWTQLTFLVPFNNLGKNIMLRNGGLPISRVAPLDQLLPLSLGSSG